MTTVDDSPSARARNAERRTKYHEGDVVVVGAGVFGCAIAYALANQGRSVILLERWMYEPDRIVGELLQPGGVAALKKLGLEGCLEGIDAIPCYGYHVMYHGEDVVIPYPYVDSSGVVTSGSIPVPSSTPTLEHKGLNGTANGNANGTANGVVVNRHTKGGIKKENGAVKKEEEEDEDEKKKVHWSDGQPQGRSFHHGRFIMQLRRACVSHPNITVFETEVMSTIRGEHTDTILGVESRTTNRETNEKEPDYFFGQLTIIADGYSSKFRKEFIGRTPIIRSKFYALELIDCPFPPSNFGHVVIGKAFPVLLYQIGTHETRALIDVPEKLPAASPANGGVRGYIRDVVIPTLPEIVRPSFEAALADGKIPKSMPNSWLPPTKQTRHAGVLLLGDAYNMRHPLTGGGMTVAFNDVVLLAGLLKEVPNLADTKAVHEAMETFHWKRKSLTSIINVLAQALYSLFAAQDRQLKALQRGCFRYFQMGEHRTNEPMGLMGGLIHRPLTLAYHFFSVAFVAIWLNGVSVCNDGSLLGLWKLPFAMVDAVLILWKACVVFLPVFWTELN
ncbi:squalene monooxygenase [Diplogelasinospora grovesii]|uniref:Squalene monooxygenase n=1 Tax=Diplogelasinospora grovesii TaxID=303347 RepID=A0AAN6NEU0_9PEZI|nr:squalene monooxygenase [Diplogelasinospora grovesii]